MKKSLIIFASIVLLASCQSLKEEFQPVSPVKYNEPEAEQPVTMTATHTIAELAKKYTIGTPWVLDENIVISGVVSTTDRPGNFYKSFYIQDETGGIEIKVGKNGLYNDYKQGQRIYVSCRDLCLGMYGYKSGASYGNGMVQVGFKDPSGDYETSYLESTLLINTHIYKGAVESVPEPVVVSESEIPGSNATQATDSNVGKLVTIKNLYYSWYDSRYKETNEAFVLLYLDSNKNKKLSSNRIFVSGEDTGITTWAMSKNKMSEYILSGIWDDVKIGNANDQTYGTVGDHKVVDAEGNVSYPDIEKAAGSVSHYFSTQQGGKGTCVQIRTSGYSKFGDTEIPEAVLKGEKSINVTGILSLYQGKVQMVVNSLDDIEVNE